MARIRAGLVPGMEHIAPETAEDIEALYQQAKTLGDRTLMIFNIERDRAEKGCGAGAVAGLLLSGLPENVHSRTILVFEGWDDDPREVFQIPEIVDFCQGMLLGFNKDDHAQAQRVLTILVPEHVRGFREDGSVDATAFHATGALFLLSCCYPDECWTVSPEGIMRNLGENIQLLYGFFPSVSEV